MTSGAQGGGGGGEGGWRDRPRAASLFDKAATMKCTESLDMIASPL